MVGRCAATAPHDIDQSRCRKFLDEARCGLGAFVIKAEFIRQAGIGIGQHQSVTDARQGLDMRAHFPRTQGAVQAESQGIGMTQGMPEGFRRLP